MIRGRHNNKNTPDCSSNSRSVTSSAAQALRRRLGMPLPSRFPQEIQANGGLQDSTPRAHVVVPPSYQIFSCEVRPINVLQFVTGTPCESEPLNRQAAAGPGKSRSSSLSLAHFQPLQDPGTPL